MLRLNNVKFISLFQEIVPNEVKGRFFAIFQAIIGFTFPVAFFVFGVLGDMVPANHLFIIQGTGIMIIAAGYFVLAPGEKELFGYSSKELGEVTP